MEPRNSSPESTPNSSPEIPGSSGLEMPNFGQEVRQQEYNNEQTERRISQQFEAPSHEPLAPPVSTTLPPPILPPVASDNSSQPILSDDSPIVAADEDLIEKEWVDKVKKVILATKDDPALRETEIKKVQIDYVKKRYGRDIGVADAN